MADVTFDRVFKVYSNGYRALQNLCLTIEDGEFLVLVGPSGCGKSTVLRVLAGLEGISAGKLTIGGEVVNDRSPRQRDIAMVFQNYALYPHMTVRQNLEFPLRMKGVRPRERGRRVKEVAGTLGLLELLECKPKQLSGGQRQRVAMGRAMARDPSVFLLDEPLSNLDAKMRGQIRGEIARLHRENRKTTVYVTHDQVEAMTMGERVAVLRGGELQQVAPPRELYDRPANLFVAGFIGSPPMNIFPTRLSKTDSGFLSLEFGDRFLEIDRVTIERHKDLDRYLDRPLFAGLRPEAFFLGDRDNSSLTVRVETVEILGHETLVHFRAPVSRIDGESAESSLFVARIPADRPLPIGSEVTLGIKPGAFYWFTAGGDAIF